MTDKAYVSGTIAPTAASAAPGQRYDQPTSAPSEKIQAVGIGGVLATIIIWLWAVLQRSVEGLPEMPPEVAAALATILAVVFGYLKRDRKPA